MFANLPSFDIDFQINNSYLKSSYSNTNYPYIKGKKFESIYGDNKIVIMDSYLNKYYISQMKKQDNIRQEKKILDIIEKLDNKKIFNALKDDYLKEKLKIAKGYYLNKNDNKKDYFTNLFNLENYKDKLLDENKINNSEGEFFESLMKFLVCRPKKVFIKKDNRKIEALSKFKSYSKRKKQMGNIDNKKTRKKTNLQILLNLDNLNTLSRNDNFNYYNNTTSNIYNNPFYLNKSNNKNNLSFKLIDNDNNRKSNNNPYNKTYSTNFGLTNYKNFYNRKESLSNNQYNNESNNNSLADLKLDEIKMENSLHNSISDTNFGKLEERINNKNYKKMNSMRTNNLYLSSKRAIKIALSSKKSIFQLSSKDNKYNTFKNKEENEILDNNTINNKKEIVTKFHIPNISNKENKNYLNISNDEEKLEELKMIDLKIMNEKLNKKHKKIMKKFLEKIKIEEKNIKEYSNKLSNSLYIIKKNKKNNENEKRNKTAMNLNKGRIDNKKNKNINMKNKEIKIKIGNYDSFGKSKYSNPKVNKIIFGSSNNSKDTFEILQYSLHHEVKKRIEKRGFSRKLRLNGREIIDKLKIKLKSKLEN